MHDKHPHPDLLHDEDLREVTYRALLLPIWFKVCMSVIILVHGSELVHFLKLRSTLGMLNGPQYTFSLTAYWLYCGSSLAAMVICVLLKYQSKYAVKAGLPVFCVTLLLGGVSVAGHLAGGLGRWQLTVAVVNVVVMTIAVVHLFRIRKEWSVAETVM